MFRLRPDANSTIRVTVAGQEVRVPQGASAAVAMLLAGTAAARETPVGGARRMPYCMMGICFDCLAEIDGTPNRQACMVPVREGMTIAPQRGARRVDPEAA